jgi:hypothetical protein
MGILKCTHTISATGLLATAWSFPPRPSQRMRYSGTLAARMSVPSVYCRRRPGFCSSFRSRKCLRAGNAGNPDCLWRDQPRSDNRRPDTGAIARRELGSAPPDRLMEG